EGDEIKTAALHGGFAEILPDSFNVLAEAVEWPDEIDEERAKAAMERAKKRLESKTDDVDMSREEMALQRAITRINALK
ncbi:MAG: F0F1 ATP synthase subunit epsilon, partial [Lachnospiraceae bacterium]|nr:F0F1 ATP synthase subunit epsilon [Lachnospiraceae bacterium]